MNRSLVVVASLFTFFSLTYSKQLNLVDAAARGDLTQIQALIDRGANINEIIDERTPLNAAVEKQNYDAVSLLINNGAQVNLGVGKSKITPLVIALMRNNQPIVELLLDAGADPSLGMLTPDGRTLAPLAFAEAKNLKLAQLLLARGADISVLPLGSQIILKIGSALGMSVFGVFERIILWMALFFLIKLLIAGFTWVVFLRKKSFVTVILLIELLIASSVLFAPLFYMGFDVLTRLLFPIINWENSLVAMLLIIIAFALDALCVTYVLRKIGYFSDRLKHPYKVTFGITLASFALWWALLYVMYR